MSVAVELRQKRAMLVQQARAVLAKVEQEKRSALTTEEKAQYDAIESDIDSLGDRIQREEQTAAREVEMRAPIPLPHEPAHQGIAAHADGDRRRRELRSYLFGESRVRDRWEFRALQADSGSAGGYAVQQEEFVAKLIKSLDNAIVVRQFATKFAVTTADSLGFPSLDADPADAEWTVELGTGSADSTMAFGKRELKPHPLAKRIKVSQKLLRVSTMDIEQLVRERLAYKFAVTEEKGFLTGTGAGQPLGMFIASALGISTSRDVSAGNTATAIVANNLYDNFYSLKSPYQVRAQWLVHRDLVKMARKLVDAQGQYLWQPGLQAGQPDTLLGRPVIQSEYAPNTFTTALYVGLVGDLSFYWIADSVAMSIQRLEELYAETAEVGFIGRLECDGAPVLEEAFSRIKLG